MSNRPKWLISGLRLRGGEQDDPERVRSQLARALGLSPLDLGDIEIRKRSLDTRQKKASWVLSLVVDLPASFSGGKGKGLQIRRLQQEREVPALTRAPSGPPPVVVGGGPGGLFAALRLAQLGWPPVLIERGQPVEQRGRDVNRLWRKGVLDPESNAIFGEGGAGTFSDGKIYTRKRDPRVRSFLEYLVAHGALPEILTDARPHIGTDRLKVVLMNMRADLISRGVELRFGTLAVGLESEGGRVRAVRLSDGTSLPAGALLIAPGHSARDTLRWLHRDGAEVEARPTAVGVRIEHPQTLIDELQLGGAEAACTLGAASYHLAWKPRDQRHRPVFSFCMCPGGLVIAATAQAGRVVTNGMSFSNRSARLANAGLIAQVSVEDYSPFGDETDPLRGFRFQDHYEALAYELGGGGFVAPAQRVEDFLAGRPSQESIESSYRPGVRPGDVSACLPPPVAASLAAALPSFHQRMPGYAGAEAHMVAIESRTSSPVRVLRGADRQSPSIRGLYPIGEGAGYAGGIVSAAIDGMRSAEALVEEVSGRA